MIDDFLRYKFAIIHITSNTLLVNIFSNNLAKRFKILFDVGFFQRTHLIPQT